jgi:glycerophosphoryl diester phosphodiesterase
MTWPANAAGRARELAAMGVDGLITDRLDLARELGRPAEATEATA